MLHTLHLSPLSFGCYLGNQIKRKQVDGWNVDSSTYVGKEESSIRREKIETMNGE